MDLTTHFPSSNSGTGIFNDESEPSGLFIVREFIVVHVSYKMCANEKRSTENAPE